MTEIILALLALLGNCGWFVSGRKQRIEAKRASFDLSVEYINEFKNNVYNPILQEVQKLRMAIEAINDCQHQTDCPVIDKLRDNAPESR